MDLNKQLIVIILFFFLSFWYLRSFFAGLKFYQLNKSAYKKRKKGETFKEWLLYTRYKEEIPKILLVIYFAILLIHVVAIIACIVLCMIKLEYVGSIIARGIFYFDPAWMLLQALLFWQNKPGYAYDRWITKRRGQIRNKKSM